MKRLLAFNVVVLLILLFNVNFVTSLARPIEMITGVPATAGQDEARAIWQVVNFEIAANILQSERTLTAVAVLNIKNVGRAAGSGLTLRISSKAKINGVTANGASVTFHALPDARPNLQRVNLTMPSVAPNSITSISVDYRLVIDSNSGVEAISAIGSQFLPQSSWYPMLNTAFTIRGADSVPFKLKIEGGNAISSGNEKSAGTTTIYEQALNAQPFFLQGAWEKSEGAGEAKGITSFLPAGAPPEERKQAEAMMSTAAAARAFYAGLLGPAPAVPIRLVAVRRGSGFSDGGTLLLEWGAFRRSKLDASTAMTISEAIARLWIGGQTAVRGEGAGVIREGLTRYLATVFLEKQFGHDAAEAELLRQRTAYAAVAKRDAPLSRSTPLDDTYYGAVPNKSAMVWRLVERRLGTDNFMATLRTLLQSANADQSGITLAAFRSALVARGDESLKKLLDQELDLPTDLDLMVGLPQQRGAESVAALRNLGSIDVAVTVTATTDRGERIKLETTVPAQNFADAVFKTPAKIVRVEIDPDKLYPQLDYANDVVPRVRDFSEAMGDASRSFGAQDFPRAESAAREILVAAPRMQEARILLARALLGEGKLDEADKLFRSVFDEALPTAVSLAWANAGLGEIALQKGQAAEAAKRFNEAVRADAEYAATLAARAGRIKSESAPPVDDAVKTFIGQLDLAIKGGRKAELDSRVVAGELARFIGGVVGSQPEVWQSRVLRTEQLEGDLVAADVSINARELGKEQAGTAVFIVARVNGVWKLAGIELFEVR
jgi:hypothetical protein